MSWLSPQEENLQGKGRRPRAGEAGPGAVAVGGGGP